MNLIQLLIKYFLIEILLTLISSINELCLVISIIVYFLIIIKKEKCRYEIYLSSLITVLFHYLIFTLSYAEILPWETGLVILLFVLIIYYNIKLNKFSFPFDKSKEENDNMLMIKCEISNICFYMYTLHLCLTTICTPQMYFNWFLIIKNCRFTYSNFQLSFYLIFVKN
jgi:hypothetical protein